MSRRLFIQQDTLTSIANAIREKNQSVDYSYPPMSLEEFVPNIKKDVILQKYMSGADVTIPMYAIDGIKNIEAECFKNKTNLSVVIIPDSVTSIGKDAFYNTGFYNASYNWNNGILYSYHCLLDANQDLTSATIKPETRLIADNAFEKCTNLSAINIPDSVLYIGNSAFTNTAYFNDENNWDNDVLYIGNYLIKARPSLAGSYKIREGTIAIADYAFENCSNMTTIEIPGSVKNVGIGAFNGCTSIIDITLPASDIWAPILYYMPTNDKNIKVTFRGGDGVINAPLADRFFDFSSVIIAHRIKEITFDEGVREIRASFSSSGLESVTFAESVTYIGYFAFSNTLIEELIIPDGVTHIGANAFSSIYKLKSVSIGNGIKTIESGAFSYNSALETISLPDTPIDIGRNAFYSTPYYNNITNWENGDVLYIGSHLIEAKRTVTRQDVIREGTTDIAAGAFVYCNALMSIIIPNGVTKIQKSTFSDCTSLQTVYIPDSVIEMGESAWSSCYNIKDIYYSGDIVSWCNIHFEDGSAQPLYQGTNSDCVLYCNGIPMHDIYIPDSVTAIKQYAFKGYKGLTGISMSNSVNIIEKEAFYGCSNLKVVNLGQGVTHIEYEAFRYCGISSITIPDSVVSIGYDAFNGNAWDLKVWLECSNIPSIDRYSFGEGYGLVIYVYDHIYNQLLTPPSAWWSYYTSKIVRRT